MARLNDVCINITDGSHNPPPGIDFSQHIMLSSKNIDDDYISIDNPRYLSEEDYQNENRRTDIKKGDLLITIVGTVGRVAIVPVDLEGICVQRSVAVLKINQRIVHNRYLMYQLQNMRPFLEREARGVAQKGIYLKQLSSLSINVPQMDEQRRIAAVLDKVSDLIAKRRQQLDKLDELVKARFVEMFGDPVSNPMGWNVKTFEQVSELITDGEHITPRRAGKGIYLLSARNVLNHALQVENVDYIDEEEYARIAKRVVPQVGDVLISCSGSIGRSCVVPPKFRFQMVRSVALIRFCKNVNPVYAEWLIASDATQRQILQSATQSSQANLFQSKIRQLYGIFPPKEIQDQFAAFVAKIYKSKLTIQQSLDKLEVLKKALMQQYFG